MIEIRHIDKQELLGDIFPCFCQFFRAVNLERFPEEKPWSESQIIDTMKQSSDKMFRVCALEGDKMVAFSSLEGGLYKPGFGRISVNVLPDYRSQGIGSEIFGNVLVCARNIGLSRLMCQTHQRSGEEFISNRGGKVVAKESTRTLAISMVDWSMVDDWIAKGKTRNPSLSLVFTKHVDDSMIPELASFSLEIERDLSAQNENHLNITYEFEIEEWKRRQAAATSPNQSRIFLFIHDGCGEIIGCTNVSIINSDPKFASQGMTAIKRECRGSGIGKLLKSAMLRFIRENHPEIVRISTDNNDLNSPMITINDRLGFVKSTVFTDYLICLEQIKLKAG